MISKNFKLTFLTVTAALGSTFTPGVFGQAPNSMHQSEEAVPNQPAFEVVSVKPNKSGEVGGRVRLLPDGVSYTNATLQLVLRGAFGVQADQILGAPGWIRSDRFDIVAKVQSSDVARLRDLRPEQRFPMILPVLEDRFNLKFHRESRERPIYTLVISKGGLKLKEATSGDTYANGLKGPNGTPGGAGSMTTNGKITAQGIPIADLVKLLSNQRLGRPLIDKTGLAGTYDFTLQWAPDNPAKPTRAAAADGSGVAAAAPDSGEPSIFTALEEQLGLKLEPQKGEVAVIVIDHIDEQPTPN